MGVIGNIEIGACSDAPGWCVYIWDSTSSRGDWLERARGGRAVYQSIDAAHAAIRKAGWKLEVQLTV